MARINATEALERIERLEAENTELRRQIDSLTRMDAAISSDLTSTQRTVSENARIYNEFVAGYRTHTH